MKRYTFDGKGINDATDPYRRRLATLAPDAPREAGVLMAAAPELLAALADIVETFDRHNVPVDAYLRRNYETARTLLTSLTERN